MSGLRGASRATLAPAGLLGVLALGLSAALIAFPPRPAVLAAGLGALAALVVVLAVARRFGGAAVWVSGSVLGLLAGEVAALPLGGQSAHLLWSDVVIAGGLAAAFASRGLALQVGRAPFLDAAAWFTAWAACGLLTALDPLGTIAELKEWVAALVVGAAALHVARDERGARGLLGTVAVAGALIGLHMCWVTIHSPYGPAFAVRMKLVDLPWGRTNYLAGILILAMPVTLGMLGATREALARTAWSALLLAQALGLMLSSSKGAILALAGGILFAYPWVRGQARAPRVVLALVVAAGVAAALVGPLQDATRYRLKASALDFSASERVDLYQIALEAFARRPSLGVGLNDLEVLTARLRGLQTVPHNYELGYLAETGMPGLVLALVLMWALGRAFLAPLGVARTPGERSLATGLWAAFVAFVIHNQVESTIYGQQYKTLLFVAAAAAWGLGHAAANRAPGADASSE